MNKKVSYRKQIERQRSCHKFFWPGPGFGRSWRSKKIGGAGAPPHSRTDNGSVGRRSWVKWVNKFGWVTWVTGQYPWPVDSFYIVLIRYLTWCSGSWETSNGNRNCCFDCLLVPFHNLCNSVARDEQTT